MSEKQPNGVTRPNVELAPSLGSRGRERIATLAPVIALLAMLTIISIANPDFLRPENLLNILLDSSFRGIVALGMTFVIIAGGIDLSVGSLAALAGCVGIWVMNTLIEASRIVAAVGAASQAGLESPYGAIRAAVAKLSISSGLAGSVGGGIAVGLAVIFLTALAGGLLNGVLIAKGRIPPFIATLAGLVGFRSLAVSLANGGEIASVAGKAFEELGQGGYRYWPMSMLKDHYGLVIPLRWPIVIFIGVAVLLALLLQVTRFGRHVVAVGSNEAAAEYSAVAVDRVKIATYTLLGGLTGLAAMLNSSRMGAVGSGDAGEWWELDAIAAVVIGGTRMNGGYGAIWRTVVGLMMLIVIDNMLVLMDVSSHLHGLVKGVVILVAVLAQRTRRGR